MKTANFFLLILIFLSIFKHSYADEKLQLKLEEGQKISILYKFHKKTDYQRGMSGMTYEIEDKWYLNIHVNRPISEGKFVLEVNPSRYIFNNFANDKPDIHFDSRFPPDATGSTQLKFPRLFYETLNSLNIEMGIDLDKNELALLDNEKRESEIVIYLSNQKLTKEEIDKTKKQLISKIDEIREIVEDYLLKFNNATFQTKDSVLVNNADYLVKRTDHQLKLTKKSTSQKEDGIIEEHTSDATINRDNGLIIGLVSKIVQPSFKKEDGRMSERKETEKIYILVKNSENFSVQATIKGFIERPKSKQVQFQVLKDAALTEWEIFRAELDRNNRFSIDIPFEEESFIFMTNAEDERIIWRTPTKVIYAEPGDLIDFELLGEEKNQSMMHKGDRISENNCFITIRSGSIVSSQPSVDGYCHSDVRKNPYKRATCNRSFPSADGSG